jgi:hypothetical protein
MKPWNALLVGALLAPFTLGCTIVADLDSYVSADDLGCDMQLHLIEFSPHLNDAVYFQGVTRDSNELRALAIIDDMVVADRAFVMPNGIGEGEHALNFWADVSGDGFVQTSPFAGQDHSWRFEDVCNFDTNCDSGEANCFSHVAPFVNIENPVEMGNTLQLDLVGLPASVGFVEVHLIEHDADLGLRRVVGLYRKDDTGDGPTFGVELRGLAVPGRLYSADVLVDLNCDNSIDPATEVFTVTESDGSAYANSITLDVTTSDPAGNLPEEQGPDLAHPEQLVTPLAAAMFCTPPSP